MVAVNPTRVEVTDIEVTPTAAGVAVTITEQFPLTDPEMFNLRTPMQFRTLIDTDGDLISDHAVETPARFHDVNDNGVADPGDRLVLEPRNAVVIQEGVALDFGAEERAHVCRRIIDQLGGQRRSMPTSIMDPRGITRR